MKICVYAICKNERQFVERWVRSMREADDVVALDTGSTDGTVEALQAQGVTSDLSYITDQVGMFSYSGLSADQMRRLRADYGVYGLDSGRICVAALNEGNLEYVASSLAKVMESTRDA